MEVGLTKICYMHVQNPQTIVQKVIVWKKKDLFLLLPSFLHVQMGNIQVTHLNCVYH